MRKQPRMCGAPPLISLNGLLLTRAAVSLRLKGLITRISSTVYSSAEVVGRFARLVTIVSIYQRRGENSLNAPC
jgi:hypothetical protein